MEITDPIARLLGSWSTGINLGSVLLRVGLSLTLAAVIGCERASKRHSAGLRTFMLVSLASTAAMLLDSFLPSGLHLIAAASVIGSSVICVNSTLFSSRNQIRGLTTSVGLWSCGVVGLAAGAGFYTATLIVFAAVLLSLSLFPAIERYLKDRSNHFELHLELSSASFLRDFVSTIRRLGLTIDDIELNPAYVNSGLSVYSIAVSISSAEPKKYRTHSQIIEALRSLEYIHYIEEMRG